MGCFWTPQNSEIFHVFFKNFLKKKFFFLISPVVQLTISILLTSLRLPIQRECLLGVSLALPHTVPSVSLFWSVATYHQTRSLPSSKKCPNRPKHSARDPFLRRSPPLSLLHALTGTVAVGTPKDPSGCTEWSSSTRHVFDPNVRHSGTQVTIEGYHRWLIRIGTTSLPTFSAVVSVCLAYGLRVSLWFFFVFPASSRICREPEWRWWHRIGRSPISHSVNRFFCSISAFESAMALPLNGPNTVAERSTRIHLYDVPCATATDSVWS